LSNPAANNQTYTPSKGLLFFYGVPALPLAMLVGPIYAFLPNFLTETVGLSAVGVGFALSLTRLWDVVSDPIGGILSDRYGSRALWMLAGLPLSLVGVYFLFVDASGLTVPLVAAASIALYGGWTLTKLNHDAWGAELSRDYDARTSYASAREGFGLLGFLIVVVLLGAADAQGPDVLASSFGWLGWAMLVAVPLCFILAIWRVPAGERVRSQTKLSDIRMLWQDEALLRLSAAFLLNGISAALPATLFLDFVQYRLGRADWAGPLLIVYFICGILALPLWLRISKKQDKTKAWIFSMAWATMFFLIVPFLGPGDEIWFAIICVLTGISLGADLALPAAIQADIVDKRREETGRQQTGLLFALLGMLTKLAYAVGVLAYPLLAYFGFRAQGTQENSPDGLFMLGILYGLVPCIAKIAAIWVMGKFPLGRRA
jgi:Na+/melibiose symporter-like transporter